MNLRRAQTSKIKALEERCLLLPPIDSNSGSDILLETPRVDCGSNDLLSADGGQDRDRLCV